MLFRNQTLEHIAQGRVTLAFRRWQKPGAKSGGRLTTPVGVLAIESVDIVDPADIPDAEVGQSGFASRAELEKMLAQKPDVPVYRISFRLEGADPRLALREDDQLSDAEYQALSRKLDALDEQGKFGPWTRDLLERLDKEPGNRAIVYAALLSVEKEWLKVNIRKLKALGLTISLPKGYLLSPRGKAFLHLDQQAHAIPNR